MQARLDDIKNRYEEIDAQLRDPSVVMHHQKLRELTKEYKELEPIIELIKELDAVKAAQTEAQQTLDTSQDDEMKALAADELTKLQKRVDELEAQMQDALIEEDENDKRNVIVEIRAGAGGDEAALFAGNLFRMYSRYAENHGWKSKMISSNQNGLGGFKEATFSIEGAGAYGRLKFESGVHRVQRVPETEKSGRIHTSTATVAVLPEAEEVDLVIDPKDLRIDTMNSSGAGGQSVNTAYSAIRITHLPTGVMVVCQDERSQTQNRERAMQVLRARLYAMEAERLAQERADARKGQIGTGDRSEKIRTYNYPQDRITDHRIKLTLHNIAQVLDGDLDVIIDKLKEAERLAQHEHSTDTE